MQPYLFSQLKTLGHQDKSVSLVKLEAGTQGVNLGVEYSLRNGLLLDLNAGYGLVNIFRKNAFGIQWIEEGGRDFTPFVRGALRLMYDMPERPYVHRNVGHFYALQSKYNFLGNGLNSGRTWQTEINRGSQIAIGTKIILRYHFGLGYGYDLDYRVGTSYVGAGLTMGYVF